MKIKDIAGYSFIAIIAVLFIGTIYVEYFEAGFKQRRHYSNAYELALEYSKFMNYGEDPEYVEEIKLAAQSENWNAYSFDGPTLTQTNNPDLPYISNATYIFKNPDDEYNRRILTRTYIFDLWDVKWILLYSDLREFSNGKFSDVEQIKLWGEN